VLNQLDWCDYLLAREFLRLIDWLLNGASAQNKIISTNMVNKDFKKCCKKVEYTEEREEI
jgi:hypothetical protein